MCARKYQFRPDYSIPPGETIAEYMKSGLFTPQRFAASLGLNQEELSSLLRGDMPISSSLSQKLETVTPMPAEFWNELEAQYRSYIEKEWLNNIPVKELVKRGFIPSLTTVSEKAKAVLDFFGVKDLNEWKSIWMQPAVVARRSKFFDEAPHLAAVWLRIGEIEAQKCSCGPTNIRLFKESIPSMRELTTKSPEEFIPELKSICSKCGVLFLLIPEFPRLKWWGATKWLNHTASIMMNIWGKGEDKFWFSFFHEVGHVILHGEDLLLINDGTNEDKRENEANDFATKTLFGEYRDRIPTLNSKREIISFANTIGISPGIVAGQYQYMTQRYNFYHKLIKKFKWVE